MTIKKLKVSNLAKKFNLYVHPDSLVGHEDNVGEKLLMPILKTLGYDVEKDIDIKPHLSHVIISKSGLEPDYGILKQKGDAKSPRYGMVADVKRFRKSLTSTMEEKLVGYCALTGAYCGILTNGDELIIVHPTNGVIEWEYLSKIPTKVELLSLQEKSRVKYKPSDIIYAKRIIRELNESDIEGIAERCHNIIRSRKGTAVPERLYEFSKLIVARIVDEKSYKQKKQKELLITLENVKTLKGKKVTIQDYIRNILAEVRKEVGIFKKGESVDLEEDIIEEIIEYLDEYSLWSEKMDVLGHVYEKFLMNTMTGRELGGYFTPRPIVNLIVKMIDPSINQSILDPASGSGGFLISGLLYLKEKHNLHEGDAVKRMAQNFYGIDIFEIIVKLCQINLWLHGDCHDNIFRADSLELTNDTPQFIKNALKNPVINGFDIIVTNPPFGAKEGNRLTISRMKNMNKKWKDLGINLFESAYGQRGNITLQPQIPFIELCIKALKEPKNVGDGGRLGIVVDNGILSNIVEEAPIIRDLIRKYCIIEAIVGLPNGTFKAYGSHVFPAFLILRRKHKDEKQGAIFRAEPRKIGLVPARQRYLPDSAEDLDIVYVKWREWKEERPNGLKIYDKRLPIWSVEPSEITTDRIDNNYFSPASIKAVGKINQMRKFYEVKELGKIIDEITSGSGPVSEGDIPLIEASNVYPNYIAPYFEKFGVMDEDLLLKENDILIVKDGSPSTVAPITKPLIERFPKMMPTYHVYRVRLKEKYLRFATAISSYLNSKVGQAILRRYISGGVSTTIRDNELRKILVVIPKDHEVTEVNKELQKLQKSVLSSLDFLKPSKITMKEFKLSENDLPALPISYMPGAKRDKQGYFKEFEKAGPKLQHRKRQKGP